MKRTPLRRYTRLKPGGKRLKARRVSKRFAVRRNPAYTAWIRTMPCLVCGATPVDAAHVRSRAAGGDDVGNTVPLCRSHHMEQHRIGIDTFQRRYQVFLMPVAYSLGVLYQTGLPKEET